MCRFIMFEGEEPDVVSHTINSSIHVTECKIPSLFGPGVSVLMQKFVWASELSIVPAQGQWKFSGHPFKIASHILLHP